MSAGLSMMERFTSADLSISSISYECRHGKHYEVEVFDKRCGHRRVIHHTHSYRAHWAAMYEASERLILPDREVPDDH